LSVLGIGVDIVSVPRIEEAMKRAGFVERILTPRERERDLTAQYVAGRWAVKEAVAKSFGRALDWHQVEILGEAPQCVLAPELRGEGQVLVSISHERDHAVGMAVRTGL
jgi:holo-[acyl-carrier protein] synthase